MNERIIVGIRSHLKFRNYHVKFRPQFDDPEMLRPGANLPFCPSSYAIGPHWRHTALNLVLIVIDVLNLVLIVIDVFHESEDVQGQTKVNHRFQVSMQCKGFVTVFDVGNTFDHYRIRYNCYKVDPKMFSHIREELKHPGYKIKL